MASVLTGLEFGGCLPSQTNEEMTGSKKVITVSTEVALPLEITWKKWTSPADIVGWNHASDDWHCPHAENDLQDGGRFSYRMEAINGNYGFDFCGVYEKIIPGREIIFTLDDGRKVVIMFSSLKGKTHIEEHFEAEDTNPAELQKSGWQAILNNFRLYSETH